MSEANLAGSVSERVSFLVDSTMYEGRNAFPGRIYGDLDQVVRADLYYHYSTPICAQRWLDVCDDPVYGHRNLVARLDEAIPGLVKTLEADQGGPARVRLTSLGPGDGAVDEHLLRGLDRRFEVDSYCGLDFSFDLLRRAAHRLSKADGFRKPFPIKMVCGDFTGLSACPFMNSESADTHLFSLTGFTMGNYRQDDLLKSIGSLMKEGDYLLLDSRLHDYGPLTEGGFGPIQRSEGVSGHYDLDTVRRFVFGPVEVATMASAADVGINFDVTRSLTTVPNALNLVIYCSGLETTLRLTGEAVKRERLDVAVTTTYHFPDLIPWFASTGFSTVWFENFGDVAFFLLKRG